MNPLDRDNPEQYTLGKGQEGVGIVRNSLTEALVIINQVHHRRVRGACATADKRVSRKMTHGGDTYTRSIEADSSWAPVVPADCWIKSPGLIVIHNDEEAKLDPGNSIHIGFLFDPTPDPPGGRDMHSPPKQPIKVFPLNVIRPGEPYSIEPLMPLPSLLLRSCINKPVKYTVYVFPG